MYGKRPDSFRGQVLNLVLHQSDQRGYYESHPIGHQPWNLETDRFAASGRHYGQYVIPLNGGSDDILLHRAETIIAPIFPQYLKRRHIEQI